MVSYIVMKLDIDGDYKKNIVFSPSMTDKSIRTNDIFFFLLIVWVLLLTGCEKQDPLCKKGDYTYGVVCPEIYEPVCAPDGTTYANSCYAEKDGWDNSCIILGECN